MLVEPTVTAIIQIEASIRHSWETAFNVIALISSVGFFHSPAATSELSEVNANANQTSMLPQQWKNLKQCNSDGS